MNANITLKEGNVKSARMDSFKIQLYSQISIIQKFVNVSYFEYQNKLTAINF